MNPVQMYNAYHAYEKLTNIIPDIESLSTRKSLRQESEKQRLSILQRDKLICQACLGKSGIPYPPVNEHGSPHSNNLITLCRGVKENSGCHELFDAGYASRNEVAMLLPSSGGSGVGKLRQIMLDRRVTILQKNDDLLIGKIAETYPLLMSGRISEAGKIMKSFSMKNSSPEEQAEFYLHLCTIERRRRTKQAIVKALGYLKRAQAALRSCSPGSHLQSRAVYEDAYLTADYYKAEQLFIESAKLGKDSFREGASLVQSMMPIIRGSLSQDIPKTDLNRTIESGRRGIELVSRYEKADLVCAGHLFLSKLCIIGHRWIEAEKYSKLCVEYLESSHMVNGWSLDIGSNVLWLQSMIKSFDAPDPFDSIERLATVCLLRYWRRNALENFPEAIYDLGSLLIKCRSMADRNLGWKLIYIALGR